jgi:DNA ligase-1
LSFQTFAHTVYRIGEATKTNDKLVALAYYLEQAPPKDRIWTIAIFSGRRPKRLIQSGLLHKWCAEVAGLPDWLFAECYHTVGDLAETIALLVANRRQDSLITQTETLADAIAKMESLQARTDEDKRQYVEAQWNRLSFEECFVFNKLITGGFRVGVSQSMMVQALQKFTGLDASVIAHRISGGWQAADTEFDALMEPGDNGNLASKPYPFYLAYALNDPPEYLGEPDQWQAEWKWDGIRGQVIRRKGNWYVWSRGEELMTEKFPEFETWAKKLPDGICLDGEIVCRPLDADGVWLPLPFALLQTRIGRKSITKKQLKEAPVGFIAYDLLEYEGADLRSIPLADRRMHLEKVIGAVNTPGLLASPLIPFESWLQLAERRMQSRQWQSEGLMLKRRNSIYQVGRKTGDWWKWKIDPYTIDAVMVYAQKGHGRRSNLFTDYTFAVRDGEKLVTFTKAYSGLTDREFAEVDAFVKRNALEKFGPVRTVRPELVFEIAFEGIAASNRHKSGVALRFPRISRWRKDKKPEDINTLEDLKNMLEKYGSKT